MEKFAIVARFYYTTDSDTPVKTMPASYIGEDNTHKSLLIMHEVSEWLKQNPEGRVEFKLWEIFH